MAVVKIQKEQLPPLLVHLIKNMNDTNQNIYIRKSYRDRLEEVIEQINNSCKGFDAEFDRHWKIALGKGKKS